MRPNTSQAAALSRSFADASPLLEPSVRKRPGPKSRREAATYELRTVDLRESHREAATYELRTVDLRESHREAATYELRTLDLRAVQDVRPSLPPVSAALARPALALRARGANAAPVSDKVSRSDFKIAAPKQARPAPRVLAEQPPPLPRVQHVAPALTVAPRFEQPVTPVNVWEFEYPWLDYRRPRWPLLVALLLLSLCIAALAHRAQLQPYAERMLREASPYAERLFESAKLVWSAVREAFYAAAANAGWTQAQ